MAYLPPAPLNFDFSAAYPGTLDFEFLLPGVNQRVDGLGFDSSEFGNADARNKSPNVTPEGTDHAVFGSHGLHLSPAAVQTVLLAGGIAPPPLGVPFLSSTLWFDFLLPVSAPISGDAVHFQFSYPGAERRLYPRGWLSFANGVTDIKHSPFVYPIGFETLAWGEQSRIVFKKDLEQIVGCSGWDSMAFGRTTISRALWFQFVNPDYVPPTPELPFNFFERLDYTQYVFLNNFGIASLDFGRTTEAHNAREFIRPYGFFNSDEHGVQFFGDSFVSHWIRALQEFGRDFSEFGMAEIRNLQQGIKPFGIFPGNSGEPKLILMRRVVWANYGFDAHAFGLPKIKSTIGPKQQADAAGWDSSAFGLSEERPFVSFEIRHIVLLSTSEHLQMGAPVVDFRVRYLQVPGTAFVQWGKPRVGFTPVLFAAGFTEAAFGKPTIYHANVHAVQGFDAHGIGGPLVQSLRRILYVGRWEEWDLYGIPSVRNVRQYLTTDGSVFYLVPFFGVTHIHNRNRPLYPDGIPAPKFPYTLTIKNAGQATQPPSVDSLVWGLHSVTHRVRHVYPSWYFIERMGQRHYLYNSATFTFPIGIAPPPISKLHRAWFNGQKFKPIGYDDSRFGLPFIAYAVRGVQQYMPSFTFRAGTPWVSRRVRTPQPPGINSYISGWHYLEIHRNIIRTRPILPLTCGFPTVRNVTPELPTPSINSLSMGYPWVSFRVRPLKPVPISSLVVPKQEVVFRNRSIGPIGFNALTVPLPDVYTEVAGQVHPQTIAAEGIKPPDFARPQIQGSPFPAGWDSLIVDVNTWIRLQGCMPRWDWPDSLYGFGTPSLNNTQIISDVTANESHQPSWPRVEHHTIWCTHDTPRQAKDNHPESESWTDMDFGASPWFGNATLSMTGPRTLLHRRSIPDYTAGERMGTDHLIETRHRRIYPVGFAPTKWGFPTLPHPQKVWTVDFESLEFGTPTLTRPLRERQPVYPAGINSLFSPAPFVEHKNRAFYPKGFLNTEFGNNAPMVYHYPRGPTHAGGDDMAECGSETWVSHFTRELQVEGFESFEEGVTIGHFNERMRVIKGPAPPSCTVGDTLRMGMPIVDYGRGAVQHIRPYMIPPPQYCHPHSITEG